MSKDSMPSENASESVVNLLRTDETLGSFLRKNRESQGQALAEVSRKTRIGTAILQAIEADDREALPAEIFARGFVKNYARYLGLDPDEALVWFIEQNESSARQKEKMNIQEVLGGEIMAVASRFPLRHLLVLFLVVLAVLFFVYLLPEDQDGQDPAVLKVENAQPQAPVILPPPQPLAPKAENEQAALSQTSQSAAIDPERRSNEAGQSGFPGAKVERQVLSQTNRDLVSSGQQAAEGYVLEARFTEKTWLSVQLDQNRAMAFTYKPGDSEVWQAQKKIAVLVGNAGGVALTLNGKALPALGRSGESARISFPAQ